MQTSRAVPSTVTRVGFPLISLPHISQSITSSRRKLYIPSTLKYHSMSEVHENQESPVSMGNNDFSRYLMDRVKMLEAVSYTHLRAHETVLDLVCRLLLEKK